MLDSLTSPLLQSHRRDGARLTDFAGWQTPLRFTSDLAEHQAVREGLGIFDLSHMGQVEVIGPDAGRLLDHSLVGVCSDLEIGRAKYTMMVAADGGILDDLIVYRLAENEFLLVPNGINRIRVVDELHLRSNGHTANITDHTLSRALIAIQGPRSTEVLQPYLDLDLSQVRYYRSSPATLRVGEVRLPTFLARTGYTGEDGFELSVSANDALRVWDALGAEHGVHKCGLAARDTLRLEAGMPLYGNELTDRSTPYDVGLGRLVDLDRQFVGRAALQERSQVAGASLIGLRGEGRRAARAGARVYLEETLIGEVTSGVLSPTLGHPIALAQVQQPVEPDTELVVDVRGRRFPMTVAPLPFYRRRQP